MAITLEILTTLIRNQKNAIRYQTIYAFIVVIIGISLIIFSFVFLGKSEVGKSEVHDTIKLIMGIGGGFISTISAFPINQIITRMERIKVYEFFSSNIEKMSKNDIEKAEELISKSIEKII